MNKFKKLIRVMAIMLMVFTINVFGNDYVKDIEAYSITDGKVTIDIPEYDENVGWIPGQVKTAKVTVDFEDASTPGKVIKIKLPDGLRYVSYPVVSKATTGELASIETNASGTFASLLDSSTSASGLEYSEKSFTNEVVYNMKNPTEKAELTVSITVDEYLYYGEKTFSAADGIIISAEKK